jgi:hypothetical protein
MLWGFMRHTRGDGMRTLLEALHMWGATEGLSADHDRQRL